MGYVAQPLLRVARVGVKQIPAVLLVLLEGVEPQVLFLVLVEAVGRQQPLIAVLQPPVVHLLVAMGVLRPLPQIWLLVVAVLQRPLLMM